MQASMTVDSIWSILSEVPDPEIPSLNIVEMGIVRDVRKEEDVWVVDITPTYSGCPAMKAIEDDVREVLEELRLSSYEVRTVISPPWTTDWMTEEAREKLRLEGIAPPLHSSADKRSIMGRTREICCPRCRAAETKMISQFGSTACKALYVCESCKEPFDYFKCI